MTHQQPHRLLSQFPAPMEDELLDGVVSRYHHLSGNPTCRITMQELFGSQTEAPPNFILGKFDCLCSSPAGHALGSVDEVINHRTLLPAYRYILQPFQTRQISAITCLSQGVGALVPILFRGRRVMASRYRLCPQCVEIENDTKGFAYWHRSHQLCGTSVCHIHGCDLIAKCRSCETPVRTSRHLDPPSYKCNSCGMRHLASFSHPSGVRRIANLAKESLSKVLSPQNPLFVAVAFQQRLKELMAVGLSTDFMFDEYSHKYIEAECSGRFKNGAIDFLKHCAKEKDPLYIYEVGCFARFSDLLVSVDMLFGSWQMLDRAIAQCQTDPPEGIQNVFSSWRTHREKSRLLGYDPEQFASAISPRTDLPHHVGTPLEYA